MPLYVAPASSGKTSYLLKVVQTAAQNPSLQPRVCVASALQAQAWRRKLAQQGGSLGVRVYTFQALVQECLTLSGQPYAHLSDPVQYRLLRVLLDYASLEHYAPLRDRPGFIQALRDLFAELKAGAISPETFAQAVAEPPLNSPARLTELAEVYNHYQHYLQLKHWADRPGLVNLAHASLKDNPSPLSEWSLLLIDGFDDFTEGQLQLLQLLYQHVGQTIITLTGPAHITESAPDAPRLVHRRFERTRHRLEKALKLTAEPLPHPGPPESVFSHLEQELFIPQPTPYPQKSPALHLIEAPNRVTEVREALRWLKQQALTQTEHPTQSLGQLALVARDISTYRPFIRQISAEFGLPIHLVDGLPLRQSPVITALLNLLTVVLPLSPELDPKTNPQAETETETSPAEMTLPWREVVALWRSPYFDWTALPHAEAETPIGITAGDADKLAAIARHAQVLGGLSQWQAAFSALTTAQTEPDSASTIPPAVPSGSHAETLAARFERFVQRLTPPAGAQPFHVFVEWLENLIGPDPQPSARFPTPNQATALNVVVQARAVAGEAGAGDVAALRRLKDVLRGLVLAERFLETMVEPVTFAEFVQELEGAIEAASYHLPQKNPAGAILVADVVQVRGLTLQAVALLGLAEGEFPRARQENPFLRDADRRILAEQFGLALETSTESAEREFFYEAVTRPWDKLLLTRPRLTETGVLWQASSFWETIRRLVPNEALTLTSEDAVAPAQAASWPELLTSLAAHSTHSAGWQWVKTQDSARYAALETAADLFRLRQNRYAKTPFDGHLNELEATFAEIYGPAHVWSPSRLESYRTCPYFFFVKSVLKLEPRQDPAEGLAAWQLGNIYHKILEKTYQQALQTDPQAGLESLLQALQTIAPPILDSAPEEQGFRATAWWRETRRSLLAILQHTLLALSELDGDFVPWRFEMGFFKANALTVTLGEESFRLHGLIDRVDRDSAGRLRIIDYKTGGPSGYTAAALNKGRKLQLPLYALAVSDSTALNLGSVVEGFYWHIQHAQPSKFSLAEADGGPEAAINNTVELAWEAVEAARRGHFVPEPPPGGCPSFCPAAAFCWHYQPGFGG